MNLLKERITKTDYMEALKTKNSTQKLVIAELKGAIKNKEIEKKDELNDKEVIAVVKKCLKELKESTIAFSDAGNQEKVEELLSRGVYFESYLPELMQYDEMVAIVKSACENYPKEMKSMGIVMKQAKEQIDLSGKDYDGKTLSELVKEELS